MADYSMHSDRESTTGSEARARDRGKIEGSLQGQVRHGNIPFEDFDESEDMERSVGLIEDMDRTDKAIEALSGQLQVLYDRLTPLLGQERPTEDSDDAKTMPDQYSVLRERERRQARQLEHMRYEVREILERIEL